MEIRMIRFVTDPFREFDFYRTTSVLVISNI